MEALIEAYRIEVIATAEDPEEFGGMLSDFDEAVAEMGDPAEAARCVLDAWGRDYAHQAVGAA